MTPTELAAKNIGLVRWFVDRTQHDPLDKDDAIGAAHVGLMKAAHQFDPSRGHRFSTYAVMKMRSELGRARRLSCLVRVPEYHTWNEESLRRSSVLPGKKGDAARKALKYRAAAFAARLVHSGWYEAEATPPDPLDAHSIADAIDAHHDTSVLLAQLDPRQRLVMMLRHGLDGGEEWTLSQIGLVIGVSKERVRQIIKESLRICREGSR